MDCWMVVGVQLLCVDSVGCPKLLYTFVECCNGDTELFCLGPLDGSCVLCQWVIGLYEEYHQGSGHCIFDAFLCLTDRVVPC
jgi:hypothetical protein